VAGLGPLRRIPWLMALDLARVVLRRLREDVAPEDRRRLAAIVRESKGDPRRLTRRDREDLRRIVGGVDHRRLLREAAAAQAPFGTKRLLRGRR
jgi:hypothetical protein